MARNWYAEAIDVLMKRGNFNEILIEIAKVHPKAVVMANSAVNGPTWQEQCRELLKAGRKIEAIKVCHQLTGMGLKEAKEAVENLA